MEELFDKWGFPFADQITSLWRDYLNHETGEYIKDDNMWSIQEWEEWQSFQFDQGKEMQDNYYDYYNLYD